MGNGSKLSDNTDPRKELLKKKIIAIVILIAVIAAIAAVATAVCAPVLGKADDPEELRAYIAGMGIWGPLFIILVTTIQVVAAFIPAGPIEIAAGYCFGILPGALICDIGMTLGGIIVLLLVRRFGMAFIEIFISKEKIDSLKFLKTNGQSKLVIFLLFLIPGAPKDVLAYGVGLTDISLGFWIFTISVGRFPSILLTVSSGDALGDQRYGHFIIILIVIIVIGIIGASVYRIWSKKQCR